MRISLFFIISTISMYSQAAFVLDSTRYIFDESDKLLRLNIINKSEQRTAGVVSINSDIKSDGQDSPVIVASPPVFKIDSGKAQAVRLKILNKESLAKDIESLFWIEAQEIPIIQNYSANSLVISMNTKVKLFYRPSSISKNRYLAEQLIYFINNNNSITLYNPTPFHFALTKMTIHDSNKDILAPDSVVSDLAVFPPFSEVTWSQEGVTSIDSLTINAIDDWGATKSYTITGRR